MKNFFSIFLRPVVRGAPNPETLAIQTSTSLSAWMAEPAAVSHLDPHVSTAMHGEGVAGVEAPEMPASSSVLSLGEATLQEPGLYVSPPEHASVSTSMANPSLSGKNPSTAVVEHNGAALHMQGNKVLVADRPVFTRVDASNDLATSFAKPPAAQFMSKQLPQGQVNLR